MPSQRYHIAHHGTTCALTPPQLAHSPALLSPVVSAPPTRRDRDNDHMPAPAGAEEAPQHPSITAYSVMACS